MIGMLSRWINVVLRRFGREIRVVPKPLLWTPTAHLEPSFELVMADYLAHNPDPFVLQVGAFNGLDNDPLRSFLVRYHLRAMLVEPQTEPFLSLTLMYANYPRVTLRRAVVGLTQGTKTLYRVKPGTEGPAWINQIASLNKAHLLTVAGIEQHIIAEEVPSVTFANLFQEVGQNQADILVTDTEGFDYQLLKAYDIPRRLPSVVQFEHVVISKQQHNELLELFIAHGYLIAVGLTDTIAYRRPTTKPGSVPTSGSES